MANFTPGKLIKTFTAKNESEVIIRYIKWEDLEVLRDYANELSKEDTFISLSGEQLTKEEEAEFVKESLTDMEFGHGIIVVAEFEDKIIAEVTIKRDSQGKKRKRLYHRAEYGLSVNHLWRRQGVGEEISRVAIEEAKKHIDGLKLITLGLFEENEAAKKLYIKLGFKPAGRLPMGYFRKGEYVASERMYLEL